MNKEWAQAPSGEAIFLFTPENTVVKIDDAAHILAQINRYGGACKRPYSVAQHSVLASFVYPNVQPLLKLMHDCGEYIIGDVLGPYKKREEFAFLRALEARSVVHIFKSLDLFDVPEVLPEDWWMTPEAIIADQAMLCIEAESLMPPNPYWTARKERMLADGHTFETLAKISARACEALHMPVPPPKYHIAWDFDFAKEAFLKRYTQLTGRSY